MIAAGLLRNEYASQEKSAASAAHASVRTSPERRPATATDRCRAQPPASTSARSGCVRCREQPGKAVRSGNGRQRDATVSTGLEQCACRRRANPTTASDTCPSGASTRVPRVTSCQTGGGERNAGERRRDRYHRNVAVGLRRRDEPSSLIADDGENGHRTIASAVLPLATTDVAASTSTANATPSA